MNRSQLEHIIPAAAGNADTNDIVVIGSQAILLIDGAIGERSIFHETFGYYAHGVGETTATLPKGWRDRLVPIRNENTRGATGWCLEVHDLAVSKLIAAREKDLSFLAALCRHELAQPDLVKKRLEQTELPSNEARVKRYR